MRRLLAPLLYLALALTANPALSGSADIAALEALRQGDLKKLSFHAAPRPASDAAFERADGAGPGSLADYRGKYVVLNFWATWCAPCRKEMPQLQALQDAMGGDRFEVVTIATGRNSPQGIVKFFDQAGITSLPRHQDPKQLLARDMGVLGLPATVILDPNGLEIARLLGEADWNSDSARAIVKHLTRNQE